MADIDKDLRNVIVFAMADGGFDEEERAFVNGLRRQAGMDEKAYQALLADVQAGQGKLTLPRDAGEARRVIELLVMVAVVDGAVNERHRRLLERIAGCLHLDEATISRMIDQALIANAADDAAFEHDREDLYAHFQDWDADTRRARIDRLAARGPHATPAMLRILESYRVPDNAPDALTLKEMIARKLGEIGDERAAYYLVQQVNIGDLDDEITSDALRCASAEALGKITGLGFTGDPKGVSAVRSWWSARRESEQYDKLAL